MSAIKPLHVLHVGTSPDIGRSRNGVDIAAWPLLAAQAEKGMKVSLLPPGEPGDAARTEAVRKDIHLLSAPRRRFETLPGDALEIVERIQPDVVHLHSVFVPAHAQLASRLKRLGVPYFVSPHRGLNLWRGRLKKAVYGALVEKRYFREAAAIFVLSRRERLIIESWLGQPGTPVRYAELPNSIPALDPGVSLWAPPVRPRLAYIGRFDVIKKGLDRLVEIARLLPDVEITAYGSASPAERRGFERLRRRGLPPNMAFHAPVHDGEKNEAFASATMYIQPSRDEGFSMAIVEAMRLAVPVAMTAGCDLADMTARDDMGMVLPDDPVRAAADLASAMGDSDRLRRWSRAGRAWTIDALAPASVAQRAIDAYESALPGHGWRSG